MKFQKTLITAIKESLLDIAEYPDDWEVKDFSRLIKMLNKSSPEGIGIKTFASEMMKRRELDPSDIEEPLLSSAIKDAWELVKWEEVAAALASTVTKFMKVATQKINEKVN